jgi:FeS assembly SUF system protein
MQVFEQDVVEALKEVHDPEIPVNIYDLGLIYKIRIGNDNVVRIVMTLTTPNCPEAQTLPSNIETTVMDRVPGVEGVEVNIVWEPKWSKDMMSEDAKLALDMF